MTRASCVVGRGPIGMGYNNDNNTRASNRNNNNPNNRNDNNGFRVCRVFAHLTHGYPFQTDVQTQSWHRAVCLPWRFVYRGSAASSLCPSTTYFTSGV